jgi:hypothetical protein
MEHLERMREMELKSRTCMTNNPNHHQLFTGKAVLQFDMSNKQSYQRISITAKANNANSKSISAAQEAFERV